MKRIICLLIASMSLINVSAQSLWDASKPDNDFTFGVRVGADFASTDMKYTSSTHNGFHIGGTADWNIVKSISIQSGMEFVSKGFKSRYGKGDMYYVQVPVLASYRIVTPTGVQFHLNAGPYVAWGLGGSVKYSPYDMTFTRHYDQDSFGDKGFFKHLDAGLSASVWAKIGHVLLGVGYEYGLTDIAKVYGKFHNRNTMMTVGYDF